MKKRILWAIFSLVLTVAVTSFISFHLGKIVYAEQSGGSPESGVTSRIKTLYDNLVILGFGSDIDIINNWGAYWNRIKSAASWVPDGAAGVANVLIGQTFYSNNSRTEQTGTMPDKEGDNASTAQSAAVGVNYLTAPEGYYDGNDRVSATDAQVAALAADLLGVNIKSGNTIFGVAGTYPAPSSCSTQQYHDSYGASVTEVTNCSLTWTTASVPVTGDDSLAGRGGYDPRTGLVWSQLLYNNAGTVTFSATLNSIWSWNASAANNIAVGSKTASQLCSERGGGWRLPVQKELMQAYIDGSYWNLTQPSNYFWSVTEFDASNAWSVRLHYGTTATPTKTSPSQVRCVR